MQLTMRLLLASALLLVGALTVHAAGELGIIKGADEFEFIYRVKLPEIADTARIWIPLAKTDSFQTVSMQKLNIPMKWEKVQDRDYGNDICVVNAQAKRSSYDTKWFARKKPPIRRAMQTPSDIFGRKNSCR
jgi:hypothetical protein